LGWLLHEAHLGVVRRGETERADVRQLVVDAVDGRPLEDRQRVNLLPEQLVCLVEVRPCLGDVELDLGRLDQLVDRRVGRAGVVTVTTILR
jgi:hypothetical protein